MSALSPLLAVSRGVRKRLVWVLIVSVALSFIFLSSLPSQKQYYSPIPKLQHGPDYTVPEQQAPEEDALAPVEPQHTSVAIPEQDIVEDVPLPPSAPEAVDGLNIVHHGQDIDEETTAPSITPEDRLDVDHQGSNKDILEEAPEPAPEVEHPDVPPPEQQNPDQPPLADGEGLHNPDPPQPQHEHPEEPPLDVPEEQLPPSPPPPEQPKPGEDLKVVDEGETPALTPPGQNSPDGEPPLPPEPPLDSDIPQYQQHNPEAVPEPLEPPEPPEPPHDPNIAPAKPDGSPWNRPARPPRPAAERRFVIVIPATSPSTQLCKVLFSAAALGYPSPVIVNWGVDFRQFTKWDGGPNLSKIPGVLRYLEAALHEHAHPDDKLLDDDIVLIVDGYDMWFQLPPDLLLKRYHDINARANARLREQWPGPRPLPPSMYQTIVASSEKKCAPPPSAGSNLHCDRLPESPLRTDLYGPNTDKPGPLNDEYRYFRPRFINGGSYIGPAGDMRRMFRRIMFKFEEGVGRGFHWQSEQGISGEVLGEQEVWRQRKMHHAGDDDEALALLDQDYEYHIGLDYSQELSIPTVHAHRDGDIVSLGDQAEIDRYSSTLGMIPSRLRGVPEDIQRTPNPLQGIINEPNWGAMPMYADFYSEAVPICLHHNAYINGLKERRNRWWHRMWFFRSLRSLLARNLRPDEPVPLATVEAEEGRLTYWAPTSDKLKRRPRMFVDTMFEPLPEMPWDVLCREVQPDGSDLDPVEKWWDVIFQDGLGPI